MLMRTFKPAEKTNLYFANFLLQGLPCGLHRAKLSEAYELLPELAPLYESAPVSDPEHWEIDLKIHMLMKGQFPCIPNWHCDNVPRDAGGKLIYNFPIDYEEPPMFVWISGVPRTLFLADSYETPFFPSSHGELANAIHALQRKGEIKFAELPAQTWCTFDRHTPHAGQAASANGWRIFARLTNRIVLSERPVISKIRRHAQVYLPSDFHW